MVSCLTKLTVRTIEMNGPSSDLAKEFQLKTLLVACGVARMAENKAKGNAGAYAVRLPPSALLMWSICSLLLEGLDHCVVVCRLRRI